MNKSLLPFISAVLIIVAVFPAMAGEIHTAIQDGDAARVKEILKNDPETINEQADNQFHELPIHIAATTGNVEIARILIEAGAAVDAGDIDNSTALDIAAMRMHSEMVTFLLEQGADVNHRDRKGDTPLSFSCRRDNDEVIRLLLDAGADLYFRKPNGETLLHYACGRNLAFLVEHILEHGTDLETQDSNGATPLAIAAGTRNLDIVKILLEKGASPNPPVKEGGITPLIYSSWRDAVECARLLLEKGADVSVRSNADRTILMSATAHSSVEMVRLLLEHGAEVNATDENGQTALVLAVENGKTEHAAALLDAGGKPDLGTDKSGRTALQLASIRGYSEIAGKLVAAGAGINNTGNCGVSPILFAEYYGNGEVADLLKTKGVSGKGKKIDRSLAAIGKLGKKEAAIYFLGHSGWAVKTQNHLLIFDYFKQGEDPDRAGLCNGTINTAELAGSKVAVFASHFHGDHYDPGIFEWKDAVEDITYFLGLQPRDSVPQYEFMDERMEKNFGEIKLTTIHSTDAGVGMLIEVDGLTIFHAGDHANGRIGLMEEFTDEIVFLKENCPRPDICFMGIRGCSLGSPEEVKEGVEYTLEKLNPKVFLPMHASADGDAYRKFIDDISGKFKTVQMAAPGNRGDHFIYRKGKIIDPRPFKKDLASSVQKGAGCPTSTSTGCAGQ